MEKSEPVEEHERSGWGRTTSISALLTLATVSTTSDIDVDLVDVIWQSVVVIPAAWALVTLALAAIGVRPGLYVLGWIGVAGSFGLTLLGPLFKLSEWALSISPYHYVPEVVGSDPSWGPLAWVATAAGALTVTAFVGFQRRDVR